MLRPTVGGERSVIAEGSTLRELIENVDQRHPGFAGQLLEVGGAQRPFVNIYVNDEDVVPSGPRDCRVRGRRDLDPAGCGRRLV